jgi:hypothetical protein
MVKGAPAIRRLTIAITRPGVNVAERSEPAGLFRLALIALFGSPPDGDWGLSRL